jgi:hypothetical protein
MKCTDFTMNSRLFCIVGHRYRGRCRRHWHSGFSVRYRTRSRYYGTGLLPASAFFPFQYRTDQRPDSPAVRHKKGQRCRPCTSTLLAVIKEAHSARPHCWRCKGIHPARAHCLRWKGILLARQYYWRWKRILLARQYTGGGK